MTLTMCMLNQGRNHVFKVGGPVPWSMVPSTEKKLDRSTQFGAVGYIITHQKAT